MAATHLLAADEAAKLPPLHLIEVAIQELCIYIPLYLKEIERMDIHIVVMLHLLAVVAKPCEKRLEIDVAVLVFHDIPDFLVLVGQIFGIERGVFVVAEFIGGEIAKLTVTAHIQPVAISHHRAHHATARQRGEFPGVAIEAEHASGVAHIYLAILALCHVPVLKRATINFLSEIVQNRHKRGSL